MITLDNVTKSFGGAPVVQDFSLTIDDGAFCVFVGPSGCGKSTLIRLINAMLPLDAGRIEIDGRDVASSPPDELRRHIGYVIQSVGLFPHWTAARNIAAVPRLLGWPEAKVRARVDEMVALLSIDPALLDRYPAQLSGGQRQRIGIARAFAADPAIVLMDEPFSALDPVSRHSLQGEIAALHKKSGKTIVFVTHDMDEALALATQLAVIDRGRLLQSGMPADIVLQPASDFVAAFVGGEEAEMRRLDVVAVAARMRRMEAPPDLPTVAGEASLKNALRLMLAHRCTALVVVEDGQRVGRIELADMIGQAARSA